MPPPPIGPNFPDDDSSTSPDDSDGGLDSPFEPGYDSFDPVDEFHFEDHFDDEDEEEEDWEEDEEWAEPFDESWRLEESAPPNTLHPVRPLWEPAMVSRDAAPGDAELHGRPYGNPYGVDGDDPYEVDGTSTAPEDLSAPPDALSLPDLREEFPDAPPLYSEEQVFLPPDLAKAKEWGLVLSAAGIYPYAQLAVAQPFLMVTPSEVPRARREIELYERECEQWPDLLAQFDRGLGALERPISLSGLTAGIILLVFHRFITLHEAWSAAGTLDGAKVQAGEWWLTLTSLTLHADLPHVLGNAAALLLFGGLVGQRLGPGLGLLSIALAGSLGNYATLVLANFQHRAIGASTGVFAAVGMLATFQAMAMIKRHRTKLRWRELGRPFVAVAGLLALLGMSPGSDLGAHLMGMVCGVLLGFSAPYLQHLHDRVLVQVGASLLLVGGVVAAWYEALRSAGLAP